MPKVSVIIPCYNHGQYIDEAVDSVLNQTFQDFEIVLINDGSTDEFTLKKLENYNKPKTNVYHITNSGLAAARNFGINNSNGEFILPLDADDKIGETYLQKAVDIFSENHKTKLVYCSGKYFGDKNEIIEETDYIYKTLLLYNFIFCSALFRKSDFLQTYGYRPEMKFGWEDWDFWIQLLKTGGEVYRIPEILFYYRIKENSMIADVKKSEEKQKYLEQQIFKNNLDIYLYYFPNPISILREYEILKIENQKFEEVKKQIYNSLSYRIGDFILKPFKLIKKIFNK